MEDDKKKLSYDFLSWDIDTTGRRLIDEICQIGVHSPNTTYKQYVMPFRDINFTSRKKYLLRTVNIGVYRVLRETSSGKILKTKSEISALTDFLSWLEERRVVQYNKGIVLMYYELFTPAPFILIESLKKYKLLQRFKESVSGFANCYDFIKAKCEKSMQSYSIKSLAKILLNKDHDKSHDAYERARMVYEIVGHLSVGESENGLEDLDSALKNHIITIDQIEERITEMKQQLDKQNTWKPIFGPVIKLVEKRRQAINLRRHLTDADLDYDTLKEVWQKNEEIKTFLKDKLKSDISEEDMADLESMISNHFREGVDDGAKTGKFDSKKTRSPRKSHYRSKIYKKYGEPSSRTPKSYIVSNTKKQSETTRNASANVTNKQSIKDTDTTPADTVNSSTSETSNLARTSNDEEGVNQLP